MHEQRLPGAAAGADGPVAGPGPGLAIPATGGAAGQVAGPGAGMPVAAAATGPGPRMLMGQIYDAIQNEYTPVVAPENTGPPQPIAMEMHSVVNGVLYRHQGYTVDSNSCCTFMGVIHTLMRLYPEVNNQCKIFALIDISGQFSIFNPLHGAWEIFWQMGNWGKVSAFAAPHDEEDDFRARGRRLVVIMGR
ncbi:Protein of unknown function [Pyronema omphalodes CBS 100304]|uniref:Uncharacterized protein n=1 Tax=Pyronema omphalodes (strain CBS 100304) TaxID=1076935 RepID=U4L719_PYROM|nr:Protein of unknown function [Pyronema omphalodes CBS 100304]